MTPLPKTTPKPAAVRALLALGLAAACTAAAGQASPRAEPRAPAAACPPTIAPADVVLALRARDADRAGLLLRCRRDLAYAGEVRGALSSLFRSVDFDGRVAFLDELRRQGVRYLADFKPEFPSEWASYGDSPLRAALVGRNAAGVDFLLKGGDTKELAAYPALLPAVVANPPTRDARELAALADAVGRLVAAGLPTELREHEAYRIALRHWMLAELKTQQNAVGAGHVGRQWEALFAGATPAGGPEFWRTLVDRLKPRDAAARLAATTRVGSEFARPRLDAIAAMEAELKKKLAGPGLRQVPAPGSSLGYREVEAAAGTLGDDDMVLDAEQEFGATGWVSVRGVKARLGALQALRELLSSMAM